MCCHGLISSFKYAQEMYTYLDAYAPLQGQRTCSELHSLQFIYSHMYMYNLESGFLSIINFVAMGIVPCAVTD